MPQTGGVALCFSLGHPNQRKIFAIPKGPQVPKKDVGFGCGAPCFFQDLGGGSPSLKFFKRDNFVGARPKGRRFQKNPPAPVLAQTPFRPLFFLSPHPRGFTHLMLAEKKPCPKVAGVYFVGGPGLPKQYPLEKPIGI